MSKRTSSTDGSSTCTSAKKSKMQVSVTTFTMWKNQFEQEYKTISWLRCDEDSKDKTLVAQLWCQACRNHERSITGMKNFSRSWIVGSTNQKRAIWSIMQKVSSIVQQCLACKQSQQRLLNYLSLVTHL